jgi:cytochrome b6-f complex iron-sulfur subunit
MDRRQLLKLLGVGTLGTALGAGGVDALSADRGALPVVLGDLADFPLDSVRCFPDRGVAVLRTRLGITALSTRCTHLGCTVRMVGQEWVCPCHGGRYDREGRVLGGPPPAPLALLELRIGAGGEVYCYPTRTRAGRGAGPVG